MKRFIVLLVFCAAVQCLEAKTSDILKFNKSEATEIETAFFADLNDGKLDTFNYYDAFLIASGGAGPREFYRYQQKLYVIRDHALKELNPFRGEDPYALCRRLLFWLYDNVLKIYSARTTTAFGILDAGEYNCLSASILYGLLAQDLGLPVYGVMAPDHIFSMLKDPRGDKDIETTVRYGFDPGSVEVEQLRNETDYIYVPAADYENRETVTVRQLIASLYVNRIGLSLQPVSDCERDLPKYKKGYFLDPESQLLRNNIAACFNNLSLARLRRKDYAAAMDYIKQGKTFAPQNDNFRILTVQVYQAKARAAASGKKYEEAIIAMRLVLDEYPGEPAARQDMVYYYAAWGLDYFNRQDFFNAIRIFQTGNSEASDPVFSKNIRAAYYNLAVVEYNKRNFSEVMRICDAALKLFPGDSGFTALQQQASQ